MTIELPETIRRRCRAGTLAGPTAGLAPGYAQANLVIVGKEDAYDFLLFCQRNPKPCPLLEVTEPGDPRVDRLAFGADLRTDLPRYRVYERGELMTELMEIRTQWTEDSVAFLLGCSFTFESALLEAGVGVRHLEETGADGCSKNVPMYRTTRPCRPAGRFAGPLVVSMRPIPASLVARAVEVTSRFPAVHGSPVHVGDPSTLGIASLERPDWGDAVTIKDGEVPVFWACGVTPQAVVLESRLERCITHAPGHMFVTDVRDNDLAYC
ncbi:hypothetical protein Pan216_34440 [Planctomycetes bacterium Pan216]|uniref:Hydro-lyase n=1 Tax=Kolteria novifilia TaxID=2527975 RepID=A0A518B6H4_9BACT|nr:hypothetical protein Pan216_34440 [Planctomycetes bacterium Pan216]